MAASSTAGWGRPVCQPQPGSKAICGWQVVPGLQKEPQVAEDTPSLPVTPICRLQVVLGLWKGPKIPEDTPSLPIKTTCGWQVVLGLQKEPEFLPELFKRLEAGPSDPAWGDLLAFLQEMCGLAKHLQPTNCTALMTRLHHLGLFQVWASRLAYRIWAVGFCSPTAAPPS